MSSLGLLKEVVEFLWQRKLFWLAPIMLVLLLIGVLLVVSSGSALAPFIYTLF
ncbi:hypothetical protein GYA49_03180 [Candidatus Beckwithbacteria bacterium]|nr:hypothetical protein [Candidatus Beckwithbacteria bacterium]